MSTKGISVNATGLYNMNVSKKIQHTYYLLLNFKIYWENRNMFKTHLLENLAPFMCMKNYSVLNKWENASPKQKMIYDAKSPPNISPDLICIPLIAVSQWCCLW